VNTSQLVDLAEMGTLLPLFGQAERELVEEMVMDVLVVVGFAGMLVVLVWVV